MTERVERFVVAQPEAGRRLDQLVREHLPELTRRVLADLFTAGRVRVDDRMARKGDSAKAGVVVTVSFTVDAAAANPDVDLVVVRESDDWVVIDKPAGLASAARDGGDAVNVASALLARYPEMSGFGYHPREAGLIHRLDTHTSGLLLAAKHSRAFEELRHALRAGRIDKRYLAVAEALPFDAGVIASDLEAGPGAKVRVASLQHGPVGSTLAASSRARTTRYRLLRRAGTRWLVEVEINAAYRHQIRAHLAAVGSPILGDARYGSRVVLPRHALHASSLVYAGGPSALGFDVESPLPLDLSALLLP